MGVRGIISQLDLPRTFWVLWVGTLITRFGEFVAPMLTFYLTDQLGLPTRVAGFILMGHGAAQMLAAIVGGFAADGLGRLRTMLFSLFGAALLMAILGYTNVDWLVATCVIAVGFVGNLYRPACSAAVADICTPLQRGRAYATLYWGINLGAAAAPLIGGWLASIHYGLLFYGDGATSALFGLILAFAFVDRHKPTKAKASDRLSVLRDRPFVALFAIQATFGLIFMQHAFALTTRLIGGGFTTSDYGIVLSVNGICIIILQPLISRSVGRYRRTHMMMAAGLLSGIAMAAHGLASQRWEHMVCVFVWTLAEIVWFPLSGEVVAQLAPADRRGAYQGVFSLSWGLSAALAPALAGLAAAESRPHLVWWGCLVAGVAVFVGSHFLDVDKHIALRQRLAVPEPQEA